MRRTRENRSEVDEDPPDRSKPQVSVATRECKPKATPLCPVPCLHRFGASMPIKNQRGQHKPTHIPELDNEVRRERFACLPRKARSSKASNAAYDVPENAENRGGPTTSWSGRAATGSHTIHKQPPETVQHRAMLAPKRCKHGTTNSPSCPPIQPGDSSRKGSRALALTATTSATLTARDGHPVARTRHNPFTGLRLQTQTQNWHVTCSFVRLLEGAHAFWQAGLRLLRSSLRRPGERRLDVSRFQHMGSVGFASLPKAATSRVQVEDCPFIEEMLWPS